MKRHSWNESMLRNHICYNFAKGNTNWLVFITKIISAKYLMPQNCLTYILRMSQYSKQQNKFMINKIIQKLHIFIIWTWNRLKSNKCLQINLKVWSKRKNAKAKRRSVFRVSYFAIGIDVFMKHFQPVDPYWKLKLYRPLFNVKQSRLHKYL